MDYTPVITNLVKYAIGEKVNNAVYPYLRLMMQQGVGKPGELIVASVLGFEVRNQCIHGEDAYNHTSNCLVEIKCESDSDSQQLSGNAAWNSIQSNTKVQKLWDDNMQLAQAGFTKKGRLVYILTKMINETSIPGKIQEYLSCNMSKTPKTTHVQLGDYFDVPYLNKKYLERVGMSKPFKEKLLNNYA